MTFPKLVRGRPGKSYESSSSGKFRALQSPPNSSWQRMKRNMCIKCWCDMIKFLNLECLALILNSPTSILYSKSSIFHPREAKIVWHDKWTAPYIKQSNERWNTKYDYGKNDLHCSWSDFRQMLNINNSLNESKINLLTLLVSTAVPHMKLAFFSLTSITWGPLLAHTTLYVLLLVLPK